MKLIYRRAGRKDGSIMSIDERHQCRWRAEQARLQNVRDVAHILWTFAPRNDEDDETYRRRLARQDDLYAMEADARQDVANDDDVTPKV